MSFEAKDYPISDILNKVVFDIPRNQRRYVWKKSSWQDLFEDVLFSITEEKPHFIGSIVLKKGSKKDGLSYYTIIDGQQRITTITLFLVAIMKHFHENDMMDDFWGTVSYLQSKDNRNQDMVILNSEFHTSISHIIAGMINIKDPKMSITAFVDTHILSKSRDKNIGDAIKFFYFTIKDDLKSVKDIQERLRDIRATLLDMTAVKIESSSEEDSYTIFEILNARGQDLVSHELLKNYIMRYIQPVELRDEAKTKWEDMERVLGSSIDKFVRHYAIHRYGDIRDKYNSPYQAIQKNSRRKQVADLYNDIKLKSEYYEKLIHPSNGREGNCSSTEFEIFDFFRVKRFEQFRPILLSLMHQKEKEILDAKKYELTLKYIYNFFVCYTIIGEEKSNKLEDVVFKYSKLLEENYSDEVLQEFATDLKGKLPGYEWFLNAFKNIGWSKHFGLYTGDKNKKRVQVVLEVIEKFVSQRNEVSEFSIEHMLPDAEDIKNSQIGNLIPLEEKLNGNLGKKPLSEKWDVYEKSTFFSCRGVVKQYKSKSFDPQKRTEFLAKLIFNNILELNQFDFSKD